ncbi:T9SS type A sorting domain-containing protein [Chryseobacterium terrae]|uniref:T9SS type A sorting domain-containing protein n=1 Tax=Chryseobacterium terrae TaxID=3163299 RepID=A0ABW8Y225_9FLAO
MRKIYSLAFSVFTIFGYSQIQSEDFEATTLPTGWTMNIITGTVGWEFGLNEYGGYTPFATNGAIFNDDFYEEANNEADLISPAVDVTSYGTLNLSFDYSLEDFSGSGDFIVSVWNGTSWVQVFSQTNDMLFESKSIDVTAYKNAAFRVKFKYLDVDWGWGAGVDAYRLTGTTLGVNDNNLVDKKYKIGPNPVKNILTFHSEQKVSNIKLYDMGGRSVSYKNNNNNSIDLSDLKPGIYFVTYEINKTIYKDKIIKD